MSDTHNPLPEGAPLHELIIPVRWGDMDALGHVNNIMYFRYFETVRMEWFEQYRTSEHGAENDGIVIVDNHAEFLVPVVCPANALIRMAGHSPGRSSFMSTYTITVNDQLTTRGHARVVWVNNRDMKSMPMPDPIRQRIETGKG